MGWFNWIRRSRNREAQRRTLGLEGLECREMWAGDVAAYLFRGALVLQGDGAANDVAVRALTAGGFIVEGRNQTTINGGTTGFTVAGNSLGNNLVVQMGGGNDLVALTGVRAAGMIFLDGGRGNDRFELSNVQSPSLLVEDRDGNDAIQLSTVTTTGNAEIKLGKGNDTIAAPSWTVGGRMSVNMSKGDDVIVFGSLTVTGSAAIQTGKGSDQVAFIDDTRLPAGVNIQTSKGDDSVLFNPARGSGTATFGGSFLVDLHRGNDTLAFDNATTLPSVIDARGGRGSDRFSDASTTANVIKRASGFEDRSTATIATLVDAALVAMERSGINRSVFTAASTAPTVTLATTPLTFVENGAALAIDANLTVADSDSAQLTGATVSFVSGFSSGTGNDVLAVTNSNGITGTFNATTGVLTLTGNASVANYQQVLRTLTFRNTSENPSTTARVLRITVNDGTSTGQAERTINVTAVDDPGQIQLPSEFSNPTTIPTRVAGTSFTVAATINDPDTTNYTFQLDLENSGIPAGAVQPTINSSTGVITWNPPASLVGQTITIRVLAINGGGATADQESFQVRIVAS